MSDDRQWERLRNGNWHVVYPSGRRVNVWDYDMRRHPYVVQAELERDISNGLWKEADEHIEALTARLAEVEQVLAVTAQALLAACADGWHDGDETKATDTLDRYFDAAWAVAAMKESKGDR